MWYIIVFLFGMLTEFVISQLIRRWCDKIANRYYDVVSFSRIPEADGTYKVCFRHPGGHLCGGYTKKCPPDISPCQLHVRLRKFHIPRLSYRVFWEIKQQTNGARN